MMLDLRKHSVEGLRCEGLQRAQSEAMILFHDGGFQEKDWISLCNISQSEKKKSPATRRRETSVAPEAALVHLTSPALVRVRARARARVRVGALDLTRSATPGAHAT